jgi:ubiquinone/menaquinone biosynthesis C-methylase UbiE
MELFFEIHKDLPREGPGDNASTARAYALIPGLPLRPRILDIGCGPGQQTLVLAARSGGQVTALDNHRPFLDGLARLVGQAGLEQRVTLREGDMTALDFPEASFDLLWSEGAIYIIGFGRGLREWKRLLRPGGCLAVTEVCWLSDDRPAEALDFWQREYPQIRSVAENLEIVAQSGYTVIDHFTLPQSAWWDEYYTPLQARVEQLRGKYAVDAEAQKLLAATQEEIDIYRKYADTYGYEFFILQKAQE